MTETEKAFNIVVHFLSKCADFLFNRMPIHFEGAGETFSFGWMVAYILIVSTFLKFFIGLPHVLEDKSWEEEKERNYMQHLKDESKAYMNGRKR